MQIGTSRDIGLGLALGLRIQLWIQLRVRVRVRVRIRVTHFPMQRLNSRSTAKCSL